MLPFEFFVSIFTSEKNIYSYIKQETQSEKHSKLNFFTVELDLYLNLKINKRMVRSKDVIDVEFESFILRIFFFK